MALTKIKNISIDPAFRITGTEIDPTFTLTSKTVTVNTPSNATEAANKSYVDNAIAAVNNFSTIAVGGQTNVVADSAAATVTFVEGTGIIITTDANTDEITFTADASTNNTANKLVIRDGSGNFSAGVITATSLTGKFTTARDIQLTGDVTGTVGFDGSQNVQLSTTIANSGVVDDTYGSATQVGQFVVDPRGIITSASNVNIEIPSTAITDWQEAVEDTYSSSILAGTHASMTFTYDDGTGALSSTFDHPNKYDKVSVSGQTSLEASTETDTLNFAGSTGLTITTNAGTDTVTFTNSGVTSVAVSGDGISLSSTGTSGTLAVTVSSNATSANNPDTLVLRDSNGDFSAENITATTFLGAMTGNLTGDVTSSGTSTFANVDINGGAIDSTIIGGDSPSAITGTTITADTGFSGNLTGDVTGDVTSTGTSTFSNIDVNGGTIDGTAIGGNSPSTGDFTAVTTTGDLDVASGVLYVNTTSDKVGINNPSPTEALDVVGNAIVSGNATVGQDLTVTGTLTVLGTTVTVDSTTTTIVDPVITLGQGMNTSSDGKGRGIEFKYYDGTAARTGFFGFDTTDGTYKLLTAASSNNEVFTGTKAVLEADLDGKLVNPRDIELIDDVTGSVAFDGSGDVQISTTLANTAVTAGSYGAADKVSTFTVDTKGRLTAAGEAQIEITSQQVSDWDEAVQDTAAALIVNGTHTNVNVTYDDAGGYLNISVPGATAFGHFLVSGEDDIDADQAGDSVTFAGSTGLTITTDGATDTITFTNSGVTSAAVSGVGLSIDVSTGDVTIDSNATDANTPSTIVSRDSSGDFAAGTITADLIGNASTADAWSTTRTVTFATGDVTGSFNIDGSGDVSNVALTIEANSVELGTDTTGDYVEDLVAGAGIAINNTGGEGSTPEIVNDDKGSDQFIFKTIASTGEVPITADSNTATLNIEVGGGLSISTDDTTKTLTLTNDGLPAFKYVAVGQDTVEADASDDTLTLVGGTAISMTVNTSTDTITFNNDGVTSLSVSGVGLSVNASTGSVTVTSDATPNNDAGTIVSRDANGAFNAGDIGAEDITADTLTTTGAVTVGSLTSGQVTFAGASGLLSGDSDLTFNATTSTLSTINVSADDMTTGGLTVSDLTATRIPVAGTGGLLVDTANLTFSTSTNTLSTVNISASTAISSPSITDSGLTATRVVFAGSGGLLSDDANFSYNTTSDTLSISNLSVSNDVSSASLTASGLTTGRVIFASTGGLLVDDADLTFSSNTLSSVNFTASGTVEAADLKSTNLTSGSVAIVGASGVISEDADLTYDTSTDTLTTVNVSATDVATTTASVSSLTAGRVVFASTGGELVDDTVLTFASGTLTSTDVTATATVQGADAKVTTLTANRVVFSDATHKLVDDADMTFDTATNTLAVTNVDATKVDAGDITIATNQISVTTGDLKVSAGTGGNLDVNNKKIINVVNPTTDQDAATKKYVDDQVSAITNLNIDGDSGSIVIDIKTETLSINGQPNQIDTLAGFNSVSISLPSTLIAPGSVEVTTTLDVTGLSTLADVDASTLDTTGNVTIGGTLDVTGLSTLADVDASTLDTTGNVTVGGTLDATGATTLSSTLDVTGVVTTTTHVNVGGDLDVTGDTTVTTITGSGAATFDSATVTNDLQVGGSVTINGDLTVTGTTTSLQTTNTQVTDNILTLNQGETGAGVTAVTSGIEVDRGSEDNAQFVWTDSTDEWQLKVGTSLANLSLQDINASGDATVGGDLDVTGALSVSGSASFAGIDNTPIGQTTAAAGKFTTLKSTDLTATRVVFSDANDALVDDADFTYDTATDTLSILNLNITGEVTGDLVPAVDVAQDLGSSTKAWKDLYLSGSSIKLGDQTITSNADSVTVSANFNATDLFVDSVEVSDLTSGRVIFAGANGLLSDDADLTYSTGTLSTTNVIASSDITAGSLTPGRITFAGTGGLLSDDTDLTYSAGTLTTVNVNATDVTTTGDVTVGSLTANSVVFAGTGGLLSEDADLTYNATSHTLSVANITITAGISAPSITDSGLTATRVVFAGTGGLLSDDSTLTFNATTDTLTTTNLSATDITTTGLTNSNLTSGRVTFAAAGGELVDSANLAFNSGTDTLSTVNISASTAISSPSITASGLTAGRLVLAGTGGLLSDDTELTYNSTTNTLNVENLSLQNVTLGSLTATRVTFVNGSSQLVDDANFTFDTATNTLEVTNVVATDLTAGNLTSGRIVLAGTNGILEDDTDLTYSAGTLTTTTVVADLTGNVTGDVTGNVTGDLTGNVTGDVTGNVTGDLTGNVTGDLTGNVTGQVSDISNHDLDELGDVDLTDLQDQDTLRWDATSGQWVPSISGGFQMRRQRFTANGTSPSFTLTYAPSGRDYLIVTVSGIPQAGDTFSVSGTTLTLGGTPVSGEIVEVLDFSTGVFSPAANSTDDIAEGSTNFYYTDTRVKTLMGNGTLDSSIIPSATNTFDLGSASKTWKDLYLSGSTIYLGSVKIKDNNGTIQFLDANNDPAPVDLGVTLDPDIQIDGGSY